MEYSSDTNNSDKDRKMLDTFEKYSDTEKSEEKDPKKKKKRRHGVSEKEDSRKNSEYAAAKEKEDDSETEDEKSSKLDRLFAGDEKRDDKESEPELPENPEELSDEEASLITKRLLEARDDALHQELAETEPDSANEAEVLANALYVENLSERLVDSSELEETDLDRLVDETAAELDVVTEAEDITKEAASRDIVAEAEAILRPESETDDEQQISLESDVDVLATPENREAMNEPGSEDEPDIDAQTSIPPAAQSNSSSGSRGLPPSFPVGGVTPPTIPSPNAAAPMPGLPVESHSHDKEASPKYQRGADMLVGGIVGYLIGRRRGRIKTEERMKPVQESLEKKVRDLDEKIAIREQKIRKLTSEKVSREGEDAQRAVAEKVEAKVRAKQEDKEKQTAKFKVQEQNVPSEPIKLESRELDSNESTLMQNLEMPKQERQPERMASVLLAGTEFSRSEPELAESKNKPAPKELVRVMPESELLVAAAKVEVGNQSAKQMYEQGRLSKEDLRDIVEAHIQGGGKAERVIIERLRPASPESGEHYYEKVHEKQSPKQSNNNNGQDGGGSLAPAIWSDTSRPAHNLSENDKASTAADTLLATQAAKDHKEPSDSIAWIVVAGTAAVLVAAFFIF